MDNMEQTAHNNGLEIAIIGLTGRFPGAKNVEEFWHNVLHGEETLSFFSDEELLAAGVDRAQLQDPTYVKVNGVVKEADLFDASFFGYSPREAELIDPQQRLFLECAEEALEHAGYDTHAYRQPIGVYASVGISTYFLRNVYPHYASRSIDALQEVIANDKDFLASRVSYKLNLQGPSVVVQTACSSSLVAVHLACQSLLSGECHMALAGGVSIRFPQEVGYRYQEGSIASPDGHCRAFDAQAQGTTFGNGIGVVILKRLEDAVAEGDTIHAIIKGSAINNDGSAKVGYTAPSIQGQAKVIKRALLTAEITPETIGYIEAHGTGTPVGDPIEIAALKQAFHTKTSKKQFCAISSVKTNIGHLDAAAGIAGLIKTVGALKYHVLPPSLHFHEANPALDLANSPFYVNTTATHWEQSSQPRRAGVSSFGIGGTNAHVVLEEAPVVTQRPIHHSPENYLLVISARSDAALQQARKHLVAHLQQNPGQTFADVAYTLQLGRRAFAHRSIAVCQDGADAVQVLNDAASPRLLSTVAHLTERPLVFLFPGQGAQYVRMGRDLYQNESIFQAQIDICADLLEPYLGLDVRTILFPDSITEQAKQQLNQTWLTQPALFVIEYALAKLWQAWGIQPTACIGHSIGEYVAACLANVFTLEDALRLVALRGRLMQQAPIGAMLAISLSEQQIQPLLNKQLCIAAINAPNQCVIAGTTPDVAMLESYLNTQGIDCQRLHTSHAFHSMLVDPVLPLFADHLKSVQLHTPQLPYISSVTGTWITAAQATDPTYWVQQLRLPVRFADGVRELLREPERVFLEVGPGHTLSTFIKQQLSNNEQKIPPALITSLPRAKEAETLSDMQFLLTSLGRLWLAGVDVEWSKLYLAEPRNRIPLPTYPFERQRYWMEPPTYTFSHLNTPSLPANSMDGVLIPATNEMEPREQQTVYARPNIATSYVAPRTSLEQTITEIWQVLLGVDKIGVFDDFYQLGGHSLLATQLVSRLRATLHVEIPLRAVLEVMTVAELAERVETLPTSQHPHQELAIISASRPDPLPLSSAQQRLWLLCQLEQNNAFYNVPIVLSFRGPLDREILRRSLQVTINRHEVLHTIFREVDGQPVQIITPGFTMELPLVDLQALLTQVQEQEWLRLATEEAQRLFSLSDGPLIRAVLLRLHERDHILLATMHHIISDGWSMGVFGREMATIYVSLAKGELPQLRDLPIQYADYAAWQQRSLQEEFLSHQLAYWQEQLGGELPVLELPYDYPRPPVQTYHGAHQHFLVSQELTEQLRAMCQQEDVTLFILLFAAFQILLFRYSAQEDISVGIPIANRNRAETEELIGLFVNTLVLRCSLSGNPDFHTFLQQVRKICLDAYAHQDVPFEKLVEVCQPERDLSHSPLFQVMFALHNVPQPPMHFLDLSLSRLEGESGIALFDLSLELIEAENTLSGTVEYNTDLFEQATISRLIEHFQTLLESIIHTPQEHIAALFLLKNTERQHLLSDWNQTQHESEPPLHFSMLFAQQVTRFPERIAVCDMEEQLTYLELWRRVQHLSSLLHEMGVGPETLVGIYLERSAAFLVSVLAIWECAGAYVPLDPAYPQQRLQFILDHAQIPLLITTTSLKESLHDSRATSLCLESLAEWKPRILEQGPCCPLLPQHLAYVIYTSGSTGVPKGVMVNHDGMLNHLQAKVADLALTETDVVAQTASQCFDISVWQFLAGLLQAGQVHILPDAISHDPSALVQAVQQRGISILEVVPSLVGALLDVPDASDLQEAGLRWLLVTGEAMPKDLCRRWWHEQPAIGLLNAYGPTECSDDVTHAILTEATEGSQWRVPIGYPILNTQLYVLDEYMEPVPRGVIGEIYIGGHGVGRGYLGAPARTAAVFVPDPYGMAEGKRLYRTGDRGRYRADGQVEFIERQDGQVKLRGYRIELGEIEVGLAGHPQVKQSVVVLQKGAGQEMQLVGYVVPLDGPSTHELSSSALRSYLKGKLPDYMIPAYVMLIDAIPLTPNGKIDRRALPIPNWQEEQRAGGDRRLSGPLEELVAQVWQKILQRDQIGSQENFFEIGGHSLLATQVIARLRDMLGIEIPLRTLFEAPTLSALAKHLHQLQQQNQGQESTTILPMPRNQDLPLSFAQQRLWFLDQLEPDSTAYTIPSAMRLRGQLNRPALALALHTIILRHENLRTTFPSRHGEPLQHINPESLTRFMLLDLRYLPPIEREEQTRWLIQQEVERPFNLAHGPLLRCKLLQTAEEEHIFLLTMHHIISDGWSSEILIQELTTLYTALQNGEAFPLPPLPIQYADYALWQRSMLQGTVLERQLAYWKTQLAELSPLELPTDYPRSALQTFRGAREPIHLPAELSQELRTFSQREGVTLFMTLMAAFQVLLARYSRQKDIAVGMPIANRTRREVEGVIGCFVNMLVLRTNLADNPSFIDLLKRVRTTSLDAYTHQDVPFEQVVEAVQPERDQSRSPLFQVMFVLQNAAISMIELSDIQVEQFLIEQHTTKFDMNLELMETTQGLSGTIEYNIDLFNEATIRRLIRHFQTLLESIVHASQERVLALPLLSTTERDQILTKWNLTEKAYPEQPCLLHQRFEAQVEGMPDAVALIFADEMLTYQALNQRANRLASTLRQLGVKPDVLVGVCMERSLELVIALLATLKAGGAYVPLDPGYPQERLAYLLQDAQVPVLLTHSTLRERCLEREALTVLYLDTLWPTLLIAPSVNLTSTVQPENLAYMIYTSGSTGQPKGAMNTHQGICNRLLWMQDQYHLTTIDRVLQKTPYSFDVSVWEFFWPLLVGASLVLAVPEGHKDPTYLKALICERAVTTLHFVPAMLQAFLDGGSLSLCSNVQQVMCSGEALSTELQKQFFTSMPPGVGLHNLYGPTEAAVDVTFWECQRHSERGTVPIGYPIANTQMYVLDEDLQPVPIGAAGELYIGGMGLARGYWRRAELTAERFLPHPFSRTGGARLYKTGDLARYQQDGTLEYLGRLDAQVKLRGYRIELGEIEAVLVEHPVVKQCIVIMQGATVQEKRLVAYVVPQEGQLASKAISGVLRSYLKGKLPDYMIPALFVQIDTLPLTPNGKVDRRSLPVLDWHEEQIVGDKQLRGPLEELVELVWQQVLQRERIGDQENFFEIGGHSLLATQVIARLRDMLGIEIPLRMLFEAPTLSMLSERLYQYVQQNQGQEISVILPIPRNQDLPLSFAQQRLWFLHQLKPDSSAYNMSGAVRLQGNVDIRALRVAFLTLVQRHESLRTTFAEQDGQVLQHIEMEMAIFLPVIDLSGSSNIKQHLEEMQDLIQQEAQKIFDLVRGPVSRVLLLKLDQNDYIFQLTMHHIVSDGWSMGVLIRELITLYQAFTAGEPSPLAPLPIQYADYAYWQRQWLQGTVLKEHIRYWTRHLSEAHAIQLPTDYPRTSVLNTHGEQYRFQLNAELAHALRQLSRQEGVTLFMTLLATFLVLLNRLTDEEDVVVGTDSANRSQLQTEGLIGFFVNLLALRAHVIGKSPFRDLLHELREIVLGAYMHQELPFDMVVENMHLEREGNRTPLVNVLFVMQNTPSVRAELPHLLVSTVDYNTTSTKFELALFVTEEVSGLDCAVDYSTDLFERATIERMMSHYTALLHDIVVHPTSPVDQLNMYTNEQKQLNNKQRENRLKIHLNKLKDFKENLVDLS